MYDDPGADAVALTMRGTDDGGPFSFTCPEWLALLHLRRRYQEGHDLWSDHELARLRFFRWLRTTGRIEP